MSTTVKELVRDQVAAEWPDRTEEDINGHINAMTNVEMLERISSAIEFGARTQWLFRRS